MTTKDGHVIATPDRVGDCTLGRAEGCTRAEEVEHPPCAGEAYPPYAGADYQLYVEEVSPLCAEAACPDSKEEGFLPFAEAACPRYEEEVSPLYLGEGSMPDPAQTRTSATYRQEKCSWNTYKHTATRTSTVS